MPKKASTKKKAFNKKVSAKISKIAREGIRRNTRKPVSSTNKRRKVSQKQAIAVAINMTKRGKK